MSPRVVLCSAVALAALAFELPSEAQPRQSGPAPTPDVLPPAQPQEGTPPTEGASEEKKKAPATPAAGYAYADKPAASSPRARYRARGPVVNMPGFEQTSDGASRLFVQLSQSVPVEERKAQGTITYVLKGASPRVWNNTNALVTVHFNTPVSRARLVPHGQDLHFIVELRAAASPTWKMNESQDKSAMLAIDFPKGDFTQIGAGEPAASTPAEPRPSKAGRGGKAGAGPRTGGARAPAKTPTPAKSEPSDAPKP
jgi:hypothetical protein